MKVIKKVPVPLSGVMLGFAALGNLLQSYSENLRGLCGIIAAVLLVLILLKMLLFRNSFIEEMKNPISASVFCTFPMGLMLLSTYIKPLLGASAINLWYLSILLHLAMIIYFTVKFVLHFDIKTVFASWFIVYVGIVVAAVTAPAFERTDIGTVLFWFGFVSLLILLVIVSVRYVKLPVPEPATPLICIYTAPMSLCIAGYVQSVSEKNYLFLILMWLTATVLYVFSLIQAVKCLKLKFYPSYAAFTFPFVISAIASKQTMACCMKMGRPLSFISPLVMVETIVAVIFILYTLYRFIIFLTCDTEKKLIKEQSTVTHNA